VTDKATYEGLEQRVKKLEKEIVERKHTEESLRESEERFRTTFEDASTGIALMANDGYFMQVNHALCRILGYSEEELLDKTWVEITEPDDLDGCFDWLERVKAGEQSSHEKRFIHKLGHPVWIEVSSALVCDSQGRIKYYISLFHDISKRIRAEEALKESERKMKSIFQAASIGIGVVSNRVIQEANERFCEIIGYSKDELIGQSSRIVYLTDEDYEYVGSEKYRKIGRSGTGVVETCFKRKNGEIINVLLSSTPLDPKDLSIGVMFTVLDVTERKRGEEALRESEKKYRSIMESMKDAAFISSSKFQIEYVNPTMVDRIGHDATGEICHKAIYDRDEKCPWCVFDQIEQKEHVDYEMVDPKDNRYYSVTNSPISHTDGTVSKLTIFRDFTEIKTIEENLRQAQKMESIGTLAGGIAHDFNNALFSIIGYTDLTMDDMPEGSHAQSNLKEVLIAANRAKEMVQQILTFSRQSETEKKPVKVQSLVKETIKLLRTSIPTTIEIRQNIDEYCKPVMADPTQIHQVVMNLGTNAYHAMREKGGVLACGR